ncbi:hypothetical protein [Planktotalea sp.]|uniref:hypothetical protein n=1 Tax=Planktotalea sp. TaxID=2029877 RepID=UPI003D6BB914
MGSIGEARLGKLLSDLMDQKLGKWRNWQMPSVVETIGPYDPNCLSEFNLKRERICDAVGSFLRSLSEQDILLLTDSSIDDPNQKRRAWQAFLEAEVAELRKSEPSWFKAGFGNLAYEADFEHWGRMPHFTLHEAVNLSIGFEPNEFPKDLLMELAKDSKPRDFASPSLAFLIKRFELMGRAFLLARRHDASIARSDLLDWFQEVGLEVHPEFLVSLKKFSKKPSEKPPRSEKTENLSSQEKRTLLKLIAAMACEQYSFDPNVARSDAASRIRDDLELIGENMDSKTIRKWLTEAMEFVDKDYWKTPR